MRGRREPGRWHAVLGTIIESPDAPAGATAPTLTISPADHPYLLDISEPGGVPVRAGVSIFSTIVHAVGEQIPVEINDRTGQVRPDLAALAKLSARLEPDRGPGATEDGLPATRQERLERLRQLRATAAERASSPQGQSGSGPAAFDDPESRWPEY